MRRTGALDPDVRAYWRRRVAELERDAGRPLGAEELAAAHLTRSRDPEDPYPREPRPQRRGS